MTIFLCGLAVLLVVGGLSLCGLEVLIAIGNSVFGVVSRKPKR